MEKYRIKVPKDKYELNDYKSEHNLADSNVSGPSLAIIKGHS